MLKWMRARVARRGALAGLMLVGALPWLAGCGGSSSSETGTASLRLLNASAGYAALDLYVDDSKKNSAVAYGQQGDYVSLAADSSLTTMVTNAGSSSALSSSSRTLRSGVAYTLLAYGWQGALKTTLIEEDLDAADSGKAKFKVFNLASDAGALDIYLTGTDESLDDATAVVSGVSGGANVSAANQTAGTYRLRVTAAGDKTDLRLDVTGLALGSTEVTTLLLTPGSSGVLVNGLLTVQKGKLTAFTNTAARGRVVASVAGNGKVTASVNGVSLGSSVTSPTVGSYTQFAGGGSVPVVLAVNGSAVAVANQNLPAGGDYTLLVWGPATAPQVTVITDDNRLPTASNQAKLRLVHAINGLDAGLTLSADFTAVASNVQPGQASSWANLTSSTSMRLEAVSALSATPLLTLTDVSLTAKGLYTVFMLGDSTDVRASMRKER